MATDTHTTEELLQEVFSVRSVPRLYSMDQQDQLVMVMSPTGLRTKNVMRTTSNLPDQPTDWQLVACEQLQLVAGREYGSGGISIVGSCYQATTGEDRTNWEDLVCAVVICRICRLVSVLLLFVVTSYKRSKSSIINPNPMSSH
jgi:hypothetical protein